MYIITDDTCRVRASSPENCLFGAVYVEQPDGFESEYQHDWKLDDGALVYDPEQIEEPSQTLQERVDALETTTDDIILMMAELIGGE